MKIPCGGFELNSDDFKFNDNGELSLQQSGGSGGGGDNVAYAHFTYDTDADEYVCDMAVSDITDYFVNNIPVIGVKDGYEFTLTGLDAFNNIVTFQLFAVLDNELYVSTVTYSRDGINATDKTYDLSTLVSADG